MKGISAIFAAALITAACFAFASARRAGSEQVYCPVPSELDGTWITTFYGARAMDVVTMFITPANTGTRRYDMWADGESIDSGAFELDGGTLLTESDKGEKRTSKYELSPDGGFLTLTPGMYNERDEYRKILPQRDLASPVEIEGTWKSIYNSRGPMEETVTFGGGRARIENGNGVFDTEYSLKGNTLRLEYDKDRIVSYVVHIQSCYPDGPDDRILILGEYVSENVTGYPMFYLKVSGKN